MDRLYDKLIEYYEDDYYPMHMPGHKRNTEIMQMGNPYAIDITEIEGFDNLHQPEGILLELSKRISRLYGADYSFPLVNGSTTGILAGISASVNRGEKILLARNSHKSVYHAVVLMGLVPVYCYPQKIDGMTPFGGILPESIEEALITHKDIKLVVITSPSYEGVVSDIRAIAEITHKYGALLLVDEAHGAHFGFHQDFPQSAIKQGADLIIQSLHKTLPSFTQTAVLHSNIPNLNHQIMKYLAIYESSSPSYLLMAGMDRCIRMLEDKAKELFEAYLEKLDRFYKAMKMLKNLKIIGKDIIGQYGIYDLDRSKITVSVVNTRINGHQLQEMLREQYHIIMEMEASDYVLGMTSICDTKEGFDRLAKALLEIDQKLEEACNETVVAEKTLFLKAVLLPSEAWDQSTEEILFYESVGRIGAAFVSLFPPGSPILVPGEVISEELIIYIRQRMQEGITVTGLTGKCKDKIEVVCKQFGSIQSPIPRGVMHSKTWTE